MTLAADMNWSAVLAHHATRTPEKAITVFEGETTTYGEMAARAAASAGGLSERGVREGDVVGLLSYNCPEFLETVFAANYLGAIAMPINWRLAAPEVRYILEHSEARALVCDAAAVVDDLERSRVTTVWLAPAMVNAIMALPDIDQRDLTSVRVIINGGEKMPIPLIERLQRTFPSAWFADAYGLTETVSGDTFLDRDSIVTKLGSVGRPCLYLELDIWGSEGKPVSPGERGEIVMRGPKVFKGYWRDPEATAKAFEGGWFHTGDIGVRDDDG